MYWMSKIAQYNWKLKSKRIIWTDRQIGRLNNPGSV